MAVFHGLLAAPRHLISAWLQSFCIVTALVALGAVLYAPVEVQRAATDGRVTVLQCRPSDQGRLSRRQSWTLTGYIAGKRKSNLAVHDLRSGRAIAGITPPGFNPTCLAISPDERHLYFGTCDARIYAVRVEAGQPELTTPPRLLAKLHSECLDALECTADGKLLMGLGFRSLHAVNVDSGSPCWTRADISASYFVVSADQQTIICGTSRGELLELCRDTGATLQVVGRHESSICFLAASDDNQKLVATDPSGRVLLFARCRATGRWRSAPSCGISSGTRRVWFTPDGERLIGASHDGCTLVAWDLKTRESVVQLSGHTGPVLGASFPERQQMLTWGTDGTVRAWNLQTGKALRAVTMGRPRDST